MSAPSPLPLCLEKRSSILDGLVLFEKVPIERIKALLKSDLLLMTWDKEEMTGYANEKLMITAYLKAYSLSSGGVSVKYQKPRHKWGRAYPFKNIGLSPMRRKTRNALIKDSYYDFDIKNAQYAILKNICEKQAKPIPCPMIKKYCDERETLLNEVQNTYEVSRKKAKDLFIRLVSNGSFDTWCFSNKLSNKTPLEFITLLQRELQDIALIVKKENPTLYETARKLKEEKGKGSKNVIGSFFALFNQEYESRIVAQVLSYLINQTELTKITGIKLPVGSYEYDGTKLWKENVDCYEGGVESVLRLLNEKTFELTGFELEWDLKSIDEGHNLDEWIKQVEIDEKPNEELIADMNKINEALENNDCGVIETIQKNLPNNFVYSVDKFDTNKGDWYCWNGNRWERGDAPLKKAIMYNVPNWWREIMKKWDEEYGNLTFEKDEEPDCNYKLWDKTKKAMEKRIFELKSSSGMLSCVSVAKTLLNNSSLEFDTNINLFGCENGVIDIANECFRPYRFDDYLTLSCGYDYTPLLKDFKVIDNEGNVRLVGDEDMTEEYLNSFEKINNVYDKIFPDEELREYFFKVASTGMSGISIEKLFILNGAGRNGKGLTNEFLEKVFGKYCVRLDNTILTEKKKPAGNANTEIAKLDKKRWVISTEPAKNALIQNANYKELTGGGSVSGRMLYKNESDVLLHLTLVIECNKKPNFAESPEEADTDRINDILFCSRFAGKENEDEWDINTGETNNIYPIDTQLKNEFKTSIIHRNTMLNILLGNLLEVKNKNYNVDAFKPESVKQRSLEYLQKSFDIHNIFVSLFEKRVDDVKERLKRYGDKDIDWTLPKIAGEIRKSKDFYDLPKLKQKEYTSKAIQEFFMKNKIYKSSVYKDTHIKSFYMRDWRLTPITNEEDEE